MSNYLQNEIIDLLKQHELTLSTAESVTAGMISSFLATVPGCSKVFKGGMIVYSNFAKNKLCGVKEETLNQFGAISEQCVRELALNTNKKLNTDISLAISGNAGPVCDENKPAGFAYLGICIIDKIYTYELQSKQKERNDIRIDLTHMAYEKLLKLIKEMNGNEFNLAVAIVLTIAGALILALLIAEFVTYIIANRFSIFKKQKIVNLGWIVNVICIILAIALSGLLIFFYLNQPLYLGYMIFWWVIVTVAISVLIIRSLYTLKNNKKKHKVKNVLSLSPQALAQEFNITDFKNQKIEVNRKKHSKWYNGLYPIYDLLDQSIDRLTEENLVFITTQIVELEEKFSCEIIYKRNRYTFCLFLTLLQKLQDKINSEKLQ